MNFKLTYHRKSATKTTDQYKFDEYQFGFIVTDKNRLTWEWILALIVIDAKQINLSNSCAFSQSNDDFGL